MKAFKGAPKVQEKRPGLELARCDEGEVLQMAYFNKGNNHVHAFTATICGKSDRAWKMVATHGPKGAEREEFFWLPKSWRLLPVPRRANTFYLPVQKVREIGVSKVVLFNQNG